jgi:hypothetical protein
MDDSSELIGLLNELMEGSLTDGQAARLRALLHDNAEAQAHYGDLMRLHAELHFDYAAGATLLAIPADPSMPRAPALVGPDAVEDLLRAGPIAVRRGRGRRPVALAVAGAIALVAAVILAGVTLPARPARRPTAAAPRGDRPRAETRREGLGMVVKLGAAKLEAGEGPAPAEGDVVQAGSLRLASGHATLMLFNGVTLTIEGPVDLELVSDERVYCRKGVLRARVPEGAEGFVVASDGVSVVDHGTEFALNVRADGKVQVMVFEGAAEVSTFDARRARGRSQRIEPFQAYEADPGSGEIRRSTAGPEHFVASPQISAPSLILSPDYPQVIQSSRPWSYWRFESIAAGRISNEVDGRPPLHVHGSVRLGEAAGGNRTAVFQAKQSDQYLVMEGDWNLDCRLGYAVELWCLTEAIRHSSLASLVTPGPPETSPHLMMLELTAHRRRVLFPPASVRYLHRWPPGTGGGDNLFSLDHYSAYNWHHLVAQLDGARMELYVDGSLANASPVALEGETKPCRLLLGLLNDLESTPVRSRRCLVGQMDEVALYDHPLSAQEIKEHFQRASSRLDTTGD